MKRKFITPNARNDLREITRFIAQDSKEAGKRYYQNTLQSFKDLPDFMVPRRADENLPEYIRELNVTGFQGYTVRIAVFENEIYMLAAFRPGLSNEVKIKRTRLGIEKT